MTRSTRCQRLALRLRRVLAFGVDWLLHAGIAGAVFLATASAPLAVGAWVAASFADRVLLQCAAQATVGKAIAGLRVIRPLDGGRLTFRQLLLPWLVGLVVAALLVVALVSDGGFEPGLDGLGLPAVRRRGR